MGTHPPTATRLLLLLLALIPATCPTTPQGARPTGAGAGAGAEAADARRTRSAPAHSWLELLAEYARVSPSGAGAGAGADAGADAGWFPRPLPLTLPLGRDGDNKPLSVPLLVLPVPVPAPSAPPSSTCSSGQTTGSSSPDVRVPTSYPFAPSSPSAPSVPSYPSAPSVPSYPSAASVPSYPSAHATGTGFGAGGTPIVVDYEPLAPVPVEGPAPAPPHLDYVVSSQQLVELFRAQTASHAHLPPALLPDYVTREEGREPPADHDELDAPLAPPRHVRRARARRYQPPAPPPAHALRAPAPDPPQYSRSVTLRGAVTVPRAGYTEPYTVRYDAESGAARVDLHGGATGAYRTVLPDGRVQHLELRVDRSGATDVRRCARAPPRAPSAADRALPGLPDLRAFSFAGYVEGEGGAGAVLERWTRTVSGAAGDLGAARGESLTYSHELVVARAPDNTTTTPLRYTVSVDSSVLGPACDGYVHHYTELREDRPDPQLLHLDVEDACDLLEDVHDVSATDRFEPLKQFTMLHRDPRHDRNFQQFKSGFRRSYWDDTEEAVRKNLLMQHDRFVGSGNRQGATFTLDVNYLGDRLDAELGVLRGVRAEPEGYPAERFPHERDQVDAMRAQLPRRFDWRQHGAVTPVRYQGSCSSCWAFAVTAAVEGALFVRTRRLQPLSEQCLVDCAHPYGGHGCGGTWPSAAYDYIRDRGLPSLDEYTSYMEKVLTCKDREVPPVTHISSHVNVTKNSVQALKVAIRQHAPSVVIIDASTKSFIFYKKGVLYDDRCAKNKAEHAVTAVGWGEHRRQAHFILKNSWGAAWGDGGYVRLQAPANTCGVLSRPSYPRLETSDVDRPQRPQR